MTATNKASEEHSDDKDAAVDVQPDAVDPSDSSSPVGSSNISSIYDLLSPRRRHSILLVAAFASMLVPFSDTVYLPALQVRQGRVWLAASPGSACNWRGCYTFKQGRRVAWHAGLR
jgi:hypothetical protein